MRPKIFSSMAIAILTTLCMSPAISTFAEYQILPQHSVVFASSFSSSLGSYSLAGISKNTPEISNVLVSRGCLHGNNSLSGVGNAESVQSIDPAIGYTYVAWMGCNGIGFARSIDGGKSFNPTFMIPGSDNNFTSNSWDPALVVSRSGVIYLSFMFQNFGTYFFGGAPYVAVSYDHGESFSVPSKVGPTSPTEFSDRGFIAVAANGVLYETWNYAPNASLISAKFPFFANCTPAGVLSTCFIAGDFNLVISRSMDGGKTWNAPRPISPNFPRGGAWVGAPIVEPNGRVDVLYLGFKTLQNYTFGKGYYYFTSSSDGGQTWSPRVRILASDGSSANSSADWWIPVSLVRDSSGILYAAFDTQSGGKNSAWISYSLDDGKTWAKTIRLTPLSNPDINIMVTLSPSGHGKIDVAWVAVGPDFRWSIFAARFTVNGNHPQLSAPERISDRFGYSSVWGGDTIGVNSLRDSTQNNDNPSGDKNNAAVSWGYGVTVNGVNASQIYMATFHLP